MTDNSPPEEASHFNTPLEVTAFLNRRFQATGLTQIQLNQAMGLRNTGLFSKIIGGRKFISTSVHFRTICTYLGISEEQQAAIILAEMGKSRKGRSTQAEQQARSQAQE